MLLVGVGPIIKIYSTPMSKQTNFPPAECKLTVSVQFLVCVVTVVVGIRGVEGQGDAGGEDGHQDEVLEGLGESSEFKHSQTEREGEQVKCSSVNLLSRTWLFIQNLRIMKL